MRTAVLMLSLLLLLGGCKKGNGDNKTEKKSETTTDVDRLHGTWSIKSFAFGKKKPMPIKGKMIFDKKTKGFATVVMGRKRVGTKWWVEGNTLHMQSRRIDKMTFKLEGKTLTLTGRGSTMVLEKQSDKADVTPAKTRLLGELESVLNKLQKGSYRYFSKSWPDKSGTPQPCQFPASVDWTPKGLACDQPKKQFPGGSEEWKAPIWQGVLFMLSSPHKLQVRVTTKGIGNGSTSTLEVRTDRDCDGKFEVRRRVLTGVATPPKNLLNCRVTSSPMTVQNAGE